MKMLRCVLLALLFVGVWATLALAYDCEYQNQVSKKNRPLGTLVISQVDTYCGEVRKQGGGYRVKMNGRKTEVFGSQYSYEEILQYVCNSCGLQGTQRFSGQ